MSEPAIRLVRDLRAALPLPPPLPDDLRLVPLSANLAPAVHALLARAYATGGGTVPVAFDSWWAATRHDPEFDAGLCFVAMAGDRPVGFCLCWTSSFIKDVVVDPECRGRGIGSALLHAAMQRLQARGKASVALKVRADNPRAQALYRRLGFVPG